jgi:hypothetical protein
MTESVGHWPTFRCFIPKRFPDEKERGKKQVFGKFLPSSGKTKNTHSLVDEGHPNIADCPSRTSSERKKVLKWCSKK